MLTIDNLGLPASVRYAKDKKQLDPRLLEESRLVPQKTEISVTKPYLASEFEQQFSVTPKHYFALFQPPPNYFDQGRSLFRHQIIPSLGSVEKQETDTERLTHWTEAKLPTKKKKKGVLRRKEKGDQGENEKEEEEKECQRLLVLLQRITQLDKDLGLINSRRNQYQRG